MKAFGVWLAALILYVSAAGVARAEMPAAAQAEAKPATVIGGDQAFAIAVNLFIRAGDYAKALDLLETRPDIVATPEGFRLRVQLLMELNRDDEALKALETHLAAEPGDAEARFQLGEIHFRHRRDQAAALAFRLALAGHLEPFRVQMAQARLSAITARRPWRFWAGASFAPDSNLNGATDARQVELFGLPFLLDPAARRQSGISVNGFAGVERTWHVSPKLAVRSSLSVQIGDGPGKAADAASLNFIAGPEWRVGPTSVVSARPTYGVTYYGGKTLEAGPGLAISSDSYGANRRWTVDVSYQDLESRVLPGRTGAVYSAAVTRTRYFESSLWRGQASVVVRHARDPSEGYQQALLSAGRLFQGPRTTFLYIEGTALERHYQGVLPAFGKRREDRETALQMRLSKQDWLVYGAHPFASLLISQSRSNLALFSNTRQRVEFGLTREF
ncbi:MAG TPA: porin family protein [Asticcacaulis sp.]|nr:porin family protein [Asticcacaulis sp.]